MESFSFASYDEAVKLYQEKKYQESLKIIASELITEDDMKPGSINYNQRFLAAHIHWKLGNSQPATSHFNRCMVIKKDSVDPYIDLGLFQIELKKYEEAGATARKGLKIRDSAMLYYIQGVVAVADGNYWRAKDMFEKANSLEPELYISYNSLGIVLLNLKKYSDANTAFTVANALRPRSFEIINNIGISLEKMSKFDDALKYYEQAKTIDPESPVIKKNIARVEQKVRK